MDDVCARRVVLDVKAAAVAVEPKQPLLLTKHVVELIEGCGAKEHT